MYSTIINTTRAATMMTAAAVTQRGLRVAALPPAEVRPGWLAARVSSPVPG